MLDGFQFIPSIQTELALLEWENIADLADDKKYVAEFTNDGTNGWITPPDSVVTAAWAFNTFKLNNNINQTYQFEYKGNPLSNEQDNSYFEGVVVVQNNVTGTTIFPMEVLSDQEGSLALSLTPEDTDVFFIVVSMPEVYMGTEKLFSYEARIQTGVSVSTTELNKDVSFEITPNPTTDEVSISLTGTNQQDTQIRITNLVGKLLSSHELKNNESNLIIPVDTYAPGTYLVHVDYGKYREVKKLMIVR